MTAHLPNSPGYRICSRCVLDTTDPDITFDDRGVCSNCRRFERQLAVRLVPPERRGEALERVVSKVKRAGMGMDYDCILGVSGGTDSTYLALVAKRLGLRPLAVHFDNGWDSERAVRNIERALKKLGIDLVTHVVDWEEFRDLQLAFLRASTPDGEIPTDHAIIALVYREAARHGLRYILDGSNFAAEGCIPETAWSYGHLDWAYIKTVNRSFGGRRLVSYPHMCLSRLAYYVLLRRISYIPLLNFTSFRKDAAMRTLSEELGWEYYGGKHCESVYTRFFQSYILPRKFGIDKRKAHLSSLIISSGEITREAALAELAEPPLPEQVLREDREYVIKKLGLTEGEFEAIMRLPQKTFRDYTTGHRFFLAKKKILAFARVKGLTHR